MTPTTIILLWLLIMVLGMALIGFGALFLIIREIEKRHDGE